MHDRHGRRPLWTVGAVILLCSILCAAAPPPAGRRGKQRTPDAEQDEERRGPRRAAPKAPPSRAAPKAPPTPLDGMRWRLQSYRGSDGATVTPLEGSHLTARFQDGRIVSGSAGCNDFTAGYTYDAGALTVSQPASTRKSCPQPTMDQEAAYLATLHRVAGFALADGVLTLEDARGVPVLTFEREPPPVLGGTAWRMTACDDGKGGFASARRDVGVTATFEPDGRITGSAGCNAYRGKYSQDGDKLTVGTLILMSRKACPAETVAQERAYLAALRSATRAEIAGGELLLTRAGDTRAVGYTAAP